MTVCHCVLLQRWEFKSCQSCLHCTLQHVPVQQTAQRLQTGEMNIHWCFQRHAKRHFCSVWGIVRRYHYWFLFVCKIIIINTLHLIVCIQNATVFQYYCRFNVKQMTYVKLHLSFFNIFFITQSVLNGVKKPALWTTSKRIHSTEFTKWPETVLTVLKNVETLECKTHRLCF